MSRLDDAINSLSAEEIDLLNSDDQMLSDFKKKYGETSAEKAVGLTKAFNPFPQSLSPKELTPATLARPVISATDYGTLGNSDPSIREEFSRGVIRGGTFGTMGGQSEGEKLGLEGSVMNPESAVTRMSRKAGEFVGTSLPIAASAMTGGEAALMSPVVRSMVPAARGLAAEAATGLTYGAAKGAAQNLSVEDTAKEMGSDAITFPAIGAGAQSIGYLGKVYGKKLADHISNYFFNTPPKLAEHLLEKGKPSMGEQGANAKMMAKTSGQEGETLTGFKSRTDAWNMTEKEIQGLNRDIQQQLNKNTESLLKPNVPDTGIKGTPRLPYNSPTIQSPVEPVSVTLPNGQRVQIPAKFEVQETAPEIASERIGEPQKNIIGKQSIDTNFDVRQGVHTPDQETLPSGEKIPLKGESNKGVFQPETPRIEKNQDNLLKQNQNENIARYRAEYLRRQAEQESLTANAVKNKTGVINREGTIQTKDLVSGVDDVERSFQTGTHEGEVSKVKRLKQQFIDKNKPVQTLQDAITLKRKLDKVVNDGYIAAEAGKPLPAATQVDEAIANKLREHIYAIDPELGRLAAQESLMFRLQSGLKKEVALKGGEGFVYRLWKNIENLIEGSATSNLVNKGLYKAVNTKVPVTSILKRGVQTGMNLPVPKK